MVTSRIGALVHHTALYSLRDNKRISENIQKILFALIIYNFKTEKHWIFSDKTVWCGRLAVHRKRQIKIESD